jgi:hypothetical protein
MQAHLTIYKRIQNYLKNLVIEGGTLAVILSLVAILLTTSIIRIIANGKANYEVYLLEKNKLTELQVANDKLREDKEYYNSEEYKKLFLRETQNLADGGESIYYTRERPIYLEEKKSFLDISKKTNYSDWWGRLVNN